MKKCMITITEVLENETCQTVVLDISERSISVNCPKSTGIEVESINRDSHFELIFKLPHIDITRYFYASEEETPRRNQSRFIEKKSTKLTALLWSHKESLFSGSYTV